MKSCNPQLGIIDSRPVATNEERLKRDWAEANRNIKLLTSNKDIVRLEPHSFVGSFVLPPASPQASASLTASPSKPQTSATNS